jgi:hypothetical protein
MNELFEEIDGCGAEFSPDEIYRYTLTRQWDDGPCVCFLMFNPSIATAIVSDPTIRRCVGFAERWGYGRMLVLNLYAVRSTDPKQVGRMGDAAIGPMNDYWILEAVKESREIICAWGCAQHAPNILKRVQSVLGKITSQYPEFPINCLGYRKDGHPRHPLMLSYDTPREMFTWGDLVYVKT